MPKLPLRPRAKRPDLTAADLLAWADAFRERHGRWPTRKDGPIPDAGTTWSAVDACLKNGSRSLNPGSSLAKLLLDRRGRRHKQYLPRLTPALILGWADAHHARTGDWPGQDAGPVAAAPGETWLGIDCALAEGLRGLPGGSSLARLLDSDRGVRNQLDLPPLTHALILRWADAHFDRTGRWPSQTSGPVRDSGGETWPSVDACLRAGWRGLPGGGSIARLLAERRGVRNIGDLPPLTARVILTWADAHRRRTGRWPTADSGPVAGTRGETWGRIDSALLKGTRGLPGGDSLVKLLARRRGKRNPMELPPLTLARIRAWMRGHRERTGGWPGRSSGAIPESPGETWGAVYNALRLGTRGLPGGSSLAKLAAGG